MLNNFGFILKDNVYYAVVEEIDNHYLATFACGQWKTEKITTDISVIADAYKKFLKNIFTGDGVKAQITPQEIEELDKKRQAMEKEEEDKDVEKEKV